MSNITEFQLDAIKEILNVGVGKGAAQLSEMIGEKVTLSVPHIKLGLDEGIKDSGDHQKLRSVMIRFSKDYRGKAAVILNDTDCQNLITALIGKADLQTRDDVYKEVGNVILNSVLGTFSNILVNDLDFDTPDLLKGNENNLLFNSEIDERNEMILVCKTVFKIKLNSPTEGSIILLFAADSFDDLVSKIDNLISE